MNIKHLLLLLLLLPIGIYGQRRSEDDAIKVAREFFSRDCVGVNPTLYIVKAEQFAPIAIRLPKAPCRLKSCYIVNDETNNRFAIVAADERVPKILGYSDYGTFEPQSVPDGMLELLDCYDQQYESLLAYEGTVKTKETTTERISPILTAIWNQDSPFCNSCPMENEEHCVAGCVAIAMAQVMHYYKYPEHGTGSTSYTSNGHSINHSFSNDVYDWDNILDDYYDVDASEGQIDAVSKLVYSCGASVATNYGLDNSTANRNNIPFALIHYFGYNPNIVAYNRNYFSVDEWYDIIDSELEAGRPILYGAFNEKDEGHRVVVDGRDENGLYHVNWGMKHNATRTYNGYFSLDILRPAVWENGEIFKESTHEYSYRHTMVCRISPQTIGSHEDVFYADNFSITNQEIDIGQRVSFQLSSIYCNSTRSSETGERRYFDTEIGIGLFDKKFSFIKPLSCTNRTFTCQEDVALSAFAGDFSFTSEVFEEGKQYYIAPYALVEGENTPTRIRTWKGAKNHYSLEVKNGIVKLTLMGTAKEEPPVSYDEGYALLADNITTFAGSKVKLPIYLYNATEIAGFHFSITLPRGVTVVENDNSLDATMSVRGSNLLLMSSKDPDAENTYLFATIPKGEDFISGTEGVLLTLNISVDESVEKDVYEISVDNVTLTTKDEETVHTAPIISFLTISDRLAGDINGDDIVNITDAISVVNYLLKKPSSSFNLTSADVNGDGVVNITDAVAIVNIILKKQ